MFRAGTNNRVNSAPLCIELVETQNLDLGRFQNVPFSKRQIFSFFAEKFSAFLLKKKVPMGRRVGGIWDIRRRPEIQILGFDTQLFQGQAHGTFFWSLRAHVVN
jgi:hypothetical protein